MFDDVLVDSLWVGSDEANGSGGVGTDRVRKYSLVVSKRQSIYMNQLTFSQALIVSETQYAFWL